MTGIDGTGECRVPAPPRQWPRQGNKNAALTLLAATLLTVRTGRARKHAAHPRRRNACWSCRRPRVPRSRGRSATRFACAPPTCSSTSLDEGLSERIRASILLAGPLLARFGSADVPLPGGDVIGRRRVDTHLIALDRDWARTSSPTARTASVRPPACTARSSTSTRPRSLPPKTRSWRPRWPRARRPSITPPASPTCRISAGCSSPWARTSRASARTSLRVHGQETLGGASHVVCPDHIEVGSFIGMAAVTGGDVTITGCEPNDLRATLLAFKRLGVRVEIDGRDVRVPPGPGSDDRRRRARPDRQDRRRARGRRSRPT